MTEQKEGDDVIPFHKLTQWLCYSLVEAIENEAGWRVVRGRGQTGLPEVSCTTRTSAASFSWLRFIRSSANIAGIASSVPQWRTSGRSWLVDHSTRLSPFRSLCQRSGQATNARAGSSSSGRVASSDRYRIVSPLQFCIGRH